MAKTIFDDGNQSLGQKGTKVTAAHLNGLQNHRHTGLDQDGSCPIDYAVATGSDDLTVAFTPAITQHVVGFPLFVKLVSNNTGSSTFITINSLDKKPLRRISGGTFAADDLTAGAIIQIVYDGTAYRVISCPGNTIMSDFSHSKSANGYQRLPSGIIFQWGAGVGGTPVTFPLTFGNVCLFVGGNTYGANEGCYSVNVNTKSTTGFTAITESHGGSHISGTLPFNWFAIGY
jgi:hypothetical protein